MDSFQQTLTFWRRQRRYSQLTLAMEAGVSARHLAFLEKGRSRPSRAMITRLGTALALPLSARNQLLISAGFSAQYSARDFESPEMEMLRQAITHMLDRHAPYPAIAVDRMWTIKRMNMPAQKLFVPLGLVEGASMLSLAQSEAITSLIENWPDVAHHIAVRLRTESAAFGGIEIFDKLAEDLSHVKGQTALSAIGAVIPTVLRANGQSLALFSTFAQFGTPEDLLLSEMKIECFFPADQETDAFLKRLASDNSSL
jgi:transcriptional regulator with XRE-family HTH domain